MRVTPVSEIPSLKNPPKWKAFVCIHFEKHAVTNTLTRERFECKTEDEAWRRFDEIQGIVI